MSTHVFLKTAEIDGLLQKQGIVRRMSTIRSALARCLEFGLADNDKIPKDRYGRKLWKLTQKGADYVLSPPVKPPKAQRTSKKNRPVKGSVGTQVSSQPPSSAGATTVCLPLSKPSLIQAVEDTVQEFVSAQKKFSAHDVTTSLREKVNSGATVIDLIETGTVLIGGKDVAHIEHIVVRDIVHELFHAKSQALVGYGRVFNGTFMEYGPETLALQQPVNVPATTAAVIAAPSDQIAADPVVDSTNSDYDGSPTL